MRDEGRALRALARKQVAGWTPIAPAAAAAAATTTTIPPHAASSTIAHTSQRHKEPNRIQPKGWPRQRC